MPPIQYFFRFTWQLNSTEMGLTGLGWVFCVPGTANVLKAKSTYASDRSRQLAARAALLLFLFASSVGLWHHHDNSETVAACQVCHVAHAPALRTIVVAGISAPVVIGWAAPVATEHPLADRSAHRASPRAPPVA